MKTTEGKWTVKHSPPAGKDDKGGFQINTPDIDQIAFVWYLNKRLKYDAANMEASEDFGTTSAKADAILMSEAKRLLAALEKLTETADELRQLYCSELEREHHHLPQTLGLQIERARLVIAAATRDEI